MISALNKLSDGTIELTITIPWKRVEDSYQKTLAKLAQNVTIKGFRKGKAPLKRAEQKLGKPTIYQNVLKDLVTDVYLEAVKEQEIKSIINPQIKVLSLEEGKDWQIMAVTCELPEVNLKDYQSALRKELAAEKIWVPGNAATRKKSGDAARDKVGKIFKILLETCQVQIPHILTEEDVNHRLANLIDQTQKLGLTVEQYLASKGKTKEQLRQDLQQETEETLKLELILSAIADEEKIEIKEADVEKMIKGMPDEKTKKSLDNRTQRAYLRQLLRKRAVIDKLNKL